VGCNINPHEFWKLEVAFKMDLAGALEPAICIRAARRQSICLRRGVGRFFTSACVAYIGLVMSGGLSLADDAPESKAFSAESLWALKRLGDPSLAPDGTRTVIGVTTYDVEDNKGTTDLYIVATSPSIGGVPHRLVTGVSSTPEASFSPDGKWIVFVAKRDDDRQTQLYLMPADGGEVRRVTQIPTGAAAPKWFQDSRRLAFISRVWADIKTSAGAANRIKEREEPRMTARVWEHAPFSQFDHLLDDRVPHLFITDIYGREPFSPTIGSGRTLPVSDASASSYDIAPDGTEIAFSADTDRTYVRPNLDVFIVSVDGGVARDLTADNPAEDSEPLYSPDGRWLAYTRRTIPGFSGTRHLILYDRRKHNERELAPGFDRSAEGIVWAPDSTRLYGSIDDSAIRRVYVFDLKSIAPRALTSSSDVGRLAVAGQRPVLVALRQSFNEPPTLVRVDTRSGDAAKLSTFNDEILKNVKFGPAESVTYLGANQATIQMWVIKPPGFDSAKRYPILLLLHGGPHSAATDYWQWRWNAQVFAGKGYVTAWPNFHGSTGFGQEFTDSISRNWADLPYEDTIKAAAWLQAQPWIDANRMVAGGGSYGGYLAMILLGREHPFKALIAHAGLFDWYGMYGSDGGANKARYGEYWEHPEEFVVQSPNLYAANFKTPTLIIHNQLDYRVPVNNGFELFNILQNRGIPSKLVYFPDENHLVSKPQNSIFWYKTIEDWIDKYTAVALNASSL
jgi:dipeptidyl aminopeptidase/acylaminoacyl peptidase